VQHCAQCCFRLIRLGGTFSGFHTSGSTGPNTDTPTTPPYTFDEVLSYVPATHAHDGGASSSNAPSDEENDGTDDSSGTTGDSEEGDAPHTGIKHVKSQHVISMTIPDTDFEPEARQLQVARWVTRVALCTNEIISRTYTEIANSSCVSLLE
jgi:hypothetical protein